MVLREILLDEMALQVVDLLRDVGALIVKDQGDDVVRGVVLVRPEIARFVYEYAEPRALAPNTKVAG